MTLISQPIPNLLGGVSQKPYAIRAVNQLELQQNCISSPVIGLAKRPPLEAGPKISSLSTAAAVLSYDRDTDDRGTVVMPGDGTVAMTDTSGNAITVNMVAAGTYITVANPDQNLQLVPVGDYIFVLNRTVAPAMNVSTTSVGTRSTVFWIREGVTNIAYSITLDTLGTVSYTPTTATLADTTNIATQLATAITGGSGSYSVTQKGSVLIVSRSTTAYTPSCTDGFGGQGIVLIDGRTNDPANLPPRATDGYVVKIAGDLSTTWDTYYVQWQDAKAAWVEIPAPGRTYNIDNSTMPHVLQKNGSAYDFKRITWNDCPAGDTTTNPIPSFVGNAIQDVFFFRGRLGFLTKATVVMSRANDIFNYWRNTVAITTDADPIDVKVTMQNPAPMRWVVEFNGTLFFITRKGQYELALAQSPLTPSTVAFRKVSAWEASTSARPVVIGTRMYIPVQNGSFSGVIAFFNTGRWTEDWQHIYDATQITQDCSQFISGVIVGLYASLKDNMLFVRTDNSPNNLYVFQYAADEQDQVTQSSWHQWTYPSADVQQGAVAIAGTMYFVIQRPDGIYLDSVNLEPMAADPLMTYKVLLDRRVADTACTHSYDASTNTTTITLPFSETHGTLQLVGNGSSTTLKQGQIVQTTQISDSGGKSRLTCLGDLTAEHFYIGRQYNAIAQLSTIVFRQASTGGAIVAATSGHLKLKHMVLSFGDSGYFKVTVTPKARSPYTYVMDGLVLGSSDVLLGQPHLTSGVFKFPIMTENTSATIVINNDSPYPCRLLQAEWAGQFVSLSKRV